MKMDENFLSHNEVPASAQKIIGGGRLKGMTDIKPQWRIEALTHRYGLCGIGWKYVTIKEWTEQFEGEVSVHVRINLFVRVDGEWSDAIEGCGGSMLIAKEKNGFYHSDEAYKMATTDAISVACKQIGIGHNVYMGYSDSKHYKPEYMTPEPTKEELEAKKIKEMHVEINTECQKLIEEGIHINEIKNSIKKRLGTEKVGECTNLDTLVGFYSHLITKKG